MNILEFRHHEPNIRRALEAGMVSKLKIETIENPSRRADPMVGQDEQLLGKRFQPRPVEEMLSELKNRKQVAKCISDRQQDQLQQELHYMRDFRVKTEIWKKLMVRRNPATVSFVIHNVNMVADRVAQIVPNNRPRPTRCLTSMLMKADNREIERQEARLKLADLGWSLEELADFGVENIMNPSGTQLFTKLMQTHFQHKNLGEMIELHELLKSPFNLKLNKSDYKRIGSEADKREFIDEIRYEIMVFLIDCIYRHLPVDQRFSYFAAARKLRVTLKELKELLKH